MWRLCVVVLLIPVLTGCAQIADIYNDLTCMSSDNYVASVTDPAGNVIGIVEVHAGHICSWGIAEGKMGRCVKVDSWGAETWAMARDAVGAPRDVCVTCESGQVVCPPKLEGDTDGAD